MSVPYRVQELKPLGPTIRKLANQKKIVILRRSCRRCLREFKTRRVGAIFCGSCVKDQKSIEADDRLKQTSFIPVNDPDLTYAVKISAPHPAPPVFAKGYGKPIGLVRPR